MAKDKKKKEKKKKKPKHENSTFSQLITQKGKGKGKANPLIEVRINFFWERIIRRYLYLKDLGLKC